MSEDFKDLEELDLLIQEKERELHPLSSRMEELRLQFINDAAKFAAQWYQDTARLYVTKNPQITLSQSKEKLARMKAKVNDLVRSAEKVVKTALSDPDLWWHQAPRLHDSFSQYEQLEDRFPEKIDTPIRCALGELGTILEQFGYDVTTEGAKKSYPEFWFEYPKGPDYPARPYFPHLLVWSEEMQYTLQKYNGQFKIAITLFNEIQRLKDQKEKLQASQLWDST